MTNYDLKDIIDYLNSQGEMCFLPAATTEEVDEFEAKHTINLPIKYKEWLYYSDGGEYYLPAGLQLYGVAHKPTIDADDISKPSDSYIVIGALSTGDPILCEKSGNRISIYNQEAGKIEEDETFPDFFTFMKSLDDILGIGG